MKIRSGFVSNSSSSSFVASLAALSAKDFYEITKYIDSKENIDGWSYEIDEEAGLLRGYTIMDNGDFGDFLLRKGINKIRFDSDNG